VGPDGRIRTVLHIGGNIAVGPDGTLALSNSSRGRTVIRKILPDGTSRVFRVPGEYGDFDITPSGEFLLTEHMTYSLIRRVSLDGSLRVVAGRVAPGDDFGGDATYSSIWNTFLVARPRVVSHRVRIRYQTSRRTRIAAALFRGGRRVARSEKSAPPGHGAIGIGRRLRAGRYKVKLVARAGGATRLSRATVRVR
jgi:hypothetical protein